MGVFFHKEINSLRIFVGKNRFTIELGGVKLMDKRMAQEF